MAGAAGCLRRARWPGACASFRSPSPPSSQLPPGTVGPSHPLPPPPSLSAPPVSRHPLSALAIDRRRCDAAPSGRRRRTTRNGNESLLPCAAHLPCARPLAAAEPTQAPPLWRVRCVSPTPRPKQQEPRQSMVGMLLLSPHIAQALLPLVPGPPRPCDYVRRAPPRAHPHTSAHSRLAVAARWQ